MSNVIVGPGYTGHRVVERLSDCIVLSRRELDLDDDPPALPTLPDRFSLLYTVPPNKDFPGDVRLRKLLDLLGSHVTRFVYLSTTGVYGDTAGAPVDESAPLNPNTERAKRRVNAEQQLGTWSDATGSALIVLRVPAIYGPGRLGTARIKAGEPILAEAEAGPGNRIHVEDLARVCVQALDPSTPSGTYNLGDGDHRSASWFSKAVAQHLGLPSPPEVSMAEAARKVSPGRLSFLREARQVQTEKVQRALGFVPRYANAEDGIRASLAPEAGD